MGGNHYHLDCVNGKFVTVSPNHCYSIEVNPDFIVRFDAQFDDNWIAHPIERLAPETFWSWMLPEQPKVKVEHNEFYILPMNIVVRMLNEALSIGLTVCRTDSEGNVRLFKKP